MKIKMDKPKIDKTDKIKDKPKIAKSDKVKMEPKIDKADRIKVSKHEVLRIIAKSKAVRTSDLLDKFALDKRNAAQCSRLYHPLKVLLTEKLVNKEKGNGGTSWSATDAGRKFVAEGGQRIIQTKADKTEKPIALKGGKLAKLAAMIQGAKGAKSEKPSKVEIKIEKPSKADKKAAKVEKPIEVEKLSRVDRKAVKAKAKAEKPAKADKKAIKANKKVEKPAKAAKVEKPAKADKKIEKPAKAPKGLGKITLKRRK
jgi:hypothetical protein